MSLRLSILLIHSNRAPSDEVRGSAWVITKRRPGATECSLSCSGVKDGNIELHCMTSATLIEALYSCVDDYLESIGKKCITDLNEQETHLVL